MLLSKHPFLPITPEYIDYGDELWYLQMDTSLAHQFCRNVDCWIYGERSSAGLLGHVNPAFEVLMEYLEGEYEGVKLEIPSRMKQL